MILAVAIFNKLDLKENNPRATEMELTLSQCQDLTKGLFLSDQEKGVLRPGGGGVGGLWFWY